MPNGQPMPQWSPQMRATAKLHARAQRAAHRDIRLNHPDEYDQIRTRVRAENPGRTPIWITPRALNELARRHHAEYLARRHHHLAVLRQQAAEKRLEGR